MCRWFDLVVVLQTDNGVLFDRLTARGYNERKARAQGLGACRGVGASDSIHMLLLQLMQASTAGKSSHCSHGQGPRARLSGSSDC